MARHKVNIIGNIRAGKSRRIYSIPDYNVGDILDIYVSGVKNSTWVVVGSGSRPVCSECPMSKNVLKSGELCPCYELFPLCVRAATRGYGIMKFVEVENVLEGI